jgi:hypothetical protein
MSRQAQERGSAARHRTATARASSPRGQVRAADMLRGALVPGVAPQGLGPHGCVVAQHRARGAELGDAQRQHGDGAGHSFVLEARAQPFAGHRRGRARQRSPEGQGDERYGAAQGPGAVPQRPGHRRCRAQRQRAEHRGRGGGGVLHAAPEPPQRRGDDQHRDRREERDAERERRLRIG